MIADAFPEPARRCARLARATNRYGIALSGAHEVVFADVTALLKFSIEMLIATFGTTLGSDAAKSTPGLRMLKNVSAGLIKAEAKLRVDAVFREMNALEDARKDFLRIGA